MTAIAEYLEETGATTKAVAELSESPKELLSIVRGKRVRWQKIAAKVGVNRNKLYHWYWETHARSVSDEKITVEDKDKMKNDMLETLRAGGELDAEYQINLRKKIVGNREIEKTEFSIVFNNIRRSNAVQKALADR